jgi:hypothetical protein
MLAGFERYLKRRPVADPKALLRPWAEAGPGIRHVFVEDEIEMQGDQARKRIVDVYDHLAAVAEIRDGLGRDEATRVVELFFQAGDPGLARDPALVAALLGSLIKAGRLHEYDSSDAIRLAVRLCRSRPESFADVLKALTDPDQHFGLLLSEWPEAVLEPLSSGDLVHFIRESVLTPAGRLEREIEAIQGRLEQAEENRKPALNTRLANLRARLEQAVTLSAARIERLRTKLDRARGRTILERWERDLDTHLPEALRSLIGIEEVPAWMVETENLTLVATAARLKPRHRTLA